MGAQLDKMVKLGADSTVAAALIAASLYTPKLIREATDETLLALDAIDESAKNALRQLFPYTGE